ncbi:MAG TPA: C45 family peptidase, partial [Gemmataceae bacterium]|nr:C45 family peptidase [Gemmataceae bacterium]
MRRFIWAVVALVLAVPAFAADTRFPEAKSGKGELKYVNGIPVLTLDGTPEEIGTQFGELALVPAKKPLIGRVDSYMKQIGWEKVFPTMIKFADIVYYSLPKQNQVELKTAAKVADVDKNLLTALNAIPDLAKMGGCSTLVVEPARSTTGAPLFGRILDWPPFEELPEYTLVIVYRPKDKHAFAAVTFPVLFGVLSGMNDAGLSLAINEITASKDESKSPNMSGTPMLFLFRKILEECTTLDEVEKMLKEHKRTTWFCLTVCDAKGGCVFEVTPRNVVRRTGEKDVCCCTNHFRTDELSVTKKCRRYAKLEELQKADGKLGVAEIAKALDSVNQESSTMQSMVFEPGDRVLHLAYGGNKTATAKPL